MAQHTGERTMQEFTTRQKLIELKLNEQDQEVMRDMGCPSGFEILPAEEAPHPKVVKCACHWGYFYAWLNPQRELVVCDMWIRSAVEARAA
jgi:hypothetical protein